MTSAPDVRAPGMYALFTSIPLVGHINPLLRQAEALRRRGWRVALATTSNMAAHVAAEAPDVAFVDLGSLGAVEASLRHDQARASMGRRFDAGTLGIVRGLTAAWPVMFDGLSAAIARDRPDVMVADLFTAAGVCAADAAGIPVVIHNANLLGAMSVKLLPPADHLPLLFSGRSRGEVGAGQRLFGPVIRAVAATVASLTIGRDLNAQRRRRGLPPVDIHERLRGRTILVMGAFGLEYERPLPASIVMVGAMLPAAAPPLPDEIERWLTAGPPVVYCNLGTMAAAPPRQLETMAAAFNADPERRVLWVLRPRARWPATAPHVRLIEWGPPPQSVLAHANVKAFVTHCGINSVHESIWAGTPMIGIPMFADQRDMAARVQDAGAGVRLDKHRFTAGDLGNAVRRVVSDERFRAAMPALQRALAHAGGADRAAELIAQAARG
jgi:UDP:flavonoid glycosyltransferase YjiC (YdhE family)